MLCRQLPRFLIRSYISPAVTQAKLFSTQHGAPKKLYRKATHCIFDLDGLLLDTESLYLKAFTEVVKSYGKTYTTELQMKHMGTPCEIGCNIIIKELNINTTLDEFQDKFHNYSHQYLGDCKMMPGAEEIAHHLRKHNVPIAIATSSQEPGYSIKTKNHKKVLSIFDHIIVSCHEKEVKRGKPFPDVYLVCANRFKDKPKPEDCLAFEDSPNGAKAAISAGMQCVMIPDPIVSKDLCKHATYIAKSLLDVPLELFGLPPLKR